MTAATRATQRPFDGKLLVVDARGQIAAARWRNFVDYLRAGDLVIANDAATLPASLSGVHERTGAALEVRLAGRSSLSPADVSFSAIVFGAGDFHTPTERRPLPPPLAPGDRLTLGPLRATIARALGHPRLVEITFDGSPDDVWSGIARHGHPIQYAHMTEPLALWDVWTAIAGPPVAFEPPSAGFILDWQSLAAMRARGIEFATITHAAGISSTGDEALDARLPFDEPYEISVAAAAAINRALVERRRVVAIGTTVVRSLEHAALAATLKGSPYKGSEGSPYKGSEGSPYKGSQGSPHIHAEAAVATQKITAGTPLRIVDVILSGVHEPATSHYQLLRAFVEDDTLRKADEVMNAHGYRTHEFGDSVLIEKGQRLSTRETSAEPAPGRWSSSAPASAALAL
jgi:S-adenosylmethionine:tRNA ribosyltransferase-isomerase